MANDHSSLAAEKVARKVFVGRLTQIVENCLPTLGKIVRVATARSEMPSLSTEGRCLSAAGTCGKAGFVKKH